VQNGITKAGTAPNGTPINSVAVDSITPTIYYTGWQRDGYSSSGSYDTSFDQYSASRLGDNFLITKAKPASTDAACKADDITGVTNFGPLNGNYTIPARCSSYVSSTLQLVDSQGDQVVVSMGQKLAFTSSASANFAVGVPNTFLITATYSGALLFTETGALPNGISFTGGTVGTLSGTPARGPKASNALP